MDNSVVVHTHPAGKGSRLSRLNEFRLKQARQRRDDAIAAARERYAHEVRTLLGHNDRKATLALARGECANSFPWPWGSFGSAAPELATPFDTAVQQERHRISDALGTISSLLERHGYRKRAAVRRG